MWTACALSSADARASVPDRAEGIADMTSLFSILLATVLLETQQGGISLKVESETTAIDPARSVFLRVELTVPRGHEAALPDLRGRVNGFSLAEDFAEEPVVAKDGSTVSVANWKLVPEPFAPFYRVRPFVVTADGGKSSFLAGPIYFEPPPAREPVTGAMEADPKKDLPPLSWKLVGWIAAALVAALAVVALLVWSVRFLLRRLREHRMSPIERAWVELERLLKKGLPGRGRYKDFYVELTMVVRRYIQRKYGIKAPHLTTEEFFAELAQSGTRAGVSSEKLRAFMTSADLVKFAGVEATPDMADEATESARGYLKGDADESAKMD